MRHAIVLGVLVVLTAAAGCDSSSSTGTCSPAPFTACSGNTLVSCVSASDGGTAGTSIRTDCTATHQVCIENTTPMGVTTASCTAPSVGQLCFSRDMLGCAMGDQLLRCVWISEMPQPGVSGDVGVWRVQTDCTVGMQMCPLMTAACTAR